MGKAVSITTAMTVGAIIGMAMGALIDPINDKQKRCIQKKSSHVFRTIGQTIDSFANMF